MSMISNALALAIVTTSGFVILYQKLPRKMRRIIEKYSLVADVCALVFTYMLLGGTLTALMAGALVGLMTSALLHIANNPDDYLFLYDLKNFIKAKLAEAKDLLKKYGESYRANRPEEFKPVEN